jgi:hypothetical protein
LPPNYLDLVFGSPPYCESRLYLEDGQNLGISRKTDAWVAWMVQVFQAAQAACKGLVAFVVAGQTNNYRWSAGPGLLIAELHRAGMNLRNPPIFHRVGIPSSGGPDWFRSDHEWIICTSKPGKLPWSDNTAMGQPPVYGPGGAPSHRRQDGSRVSGRASMEECANVGPHRARQQAGQEYHPPEVANPGNVISIPVGGGLMGGDRFSSQNEAPFPEALARFFVLSFAPLGGWVCDPFLGSGTTAAVCKRYGRNFTGCDLRASQVALARKRIACVQPELLVESGHE